MDNIAPVGVVIPAYNAAGTIRRALLSVAMQTQKPVQVIVVDDGSSDGTEAAARDCASEMSGIDLRVIQQENAGAGAARNRGISEVDQLYVAFLDADDEWLPAKLDRSMAVLTSGEFDLVAHDFVAHQNGADHHVEATQIFNSTADPLSSLYVRGYIPSITVVVRKRLIESVDGFDATLPNAQDFDLWLAMLLQPGVKFTMFDEPLARYRQGPTGIMSHTERRLACCLRIARRYAPRFPITSHILRILAVHKEAMVAHAANGKWIYAALIPARLLIALTAEPLTSCFQMSGETIRTPEIRYPRIRFAAAVWVGATLMLYVGQFGNILNPVLRVLGIK